MQRGTPAGPRLYAARRARARPNSDAQEVIANAHPLRMRGLQACRFAGALRILAQRLRRALHWVLEVTSTRGKTPVAQTGPTRLFDNCALTDTGSMTPVGGRGRVRPQLGCNTRSIPRHIGGVLNTRILQLPQYYLPEFGRSIKAKLL